MGTESLSPMCSDNQGLVANIRLEAHAKALQVAHSRQRPVCNRLPVGCEPGAVCRRQIRARLLHHGHGLEVELQRRRLQALVAQGEWCAVAAILAFDSSHEPAALLRCCWPLQ